MRGLSLLIGFVSTLSLIGCATLSEKQCRVGDWNAYGKIDGEHGRPADYWREHEASCSRYDLPVDRQAYSEGWKAGLANYCTPESGYYAGVNGESYYRTCSGDAEKAFLTEFNRGRRMRQLRADLQANDSELGDLRTRMYQDTNTGDAVLNALGLTEDSLRRRQLEDRQRYLAGELTELESAAPAASPERSEIRRQSFGAGFGALTGTFLGFGVGHAIQGRYAERGWWFTALETGALAGAIGGAAMCGSGNCRSGAGGLGALVFVSLKVWESIDVWRYFSATQSGYPHLSEIRFTPSTPIAALSFPLTF